jgi:hypothetical protein
VRNGQYTAGSVPSPGYSGAPTATLKSGSQSPTVGQSTVWTVSWSTITTFEVEVIVIWMEELEGYFEYDLSDEEIADGYADIEMILTDEEPTTAEYCPQAVGNHTCYAPADEGVTDAQFSAAPIGITATSYYVDVGFVIGPADGGDETPAGGNCGESGTCSNYITCDLCSIQFCADMSGNMGYLAGGSCYACSGSNCVSAAQSAVGRCCSTN